MLFNTVSYVGFLLIIVSTFWLLPSLRAGLLLAASLVFYALWRVDFVLLISFSALVDYYFALKIYNEARPIWRKVWLTCSLGTNLGLLGYFKYTHFLIDNISTFGGLLGQNWAIDVGEIVLPLGISFYTFLSISYTIDVYRGLFPPVRNFGIYLSYVMFWPHMIAGPILRAHELVPQLTEARSFDAERFSDGVRLIVCGLFLKVALADQIAPYVDEAFLADPSRLSALDVWTMAFAFGFQIYFDFGGYSMIAIGSARLLGIQFPANFNWPYLATSPRDFWHRWHITLSSWIRDYLYLPLCGVPFLNRSEGGLEIKVLAPTATRSALALFATWFLMGLWHGAAWTFAVWGIWHASFILLYRLASPALVAIPRPMRSVGGWLITLAIVMLGWLPFRAQSLGDTFTLLGHVANPFAYGTLTFRENFYLIIAILLVGMLMFHFVMKWASNLHHMRARYLGEIAVMAFAIFVVFIFLRPIGQFIYFQF